MEIGNLTAVGGPLTGHIIPYFLEEEPTSQGIWGQGQT